jgi:hypothetical protein
MRNLIRTLLRPDREENPERAEIAQAANLLQIGEFQLLQLAYRAWFGEEMPEDQTDRIFDAYMMHGVIPHWVRRYARKVVVLDERGDLDDRDPKYHRYDCEYYKALPLGARRLALAVMCIAFVIVGSIAVGHMTPVDVRTVLPPYIDEKHMEPKAMGGIRGS